MEKKVYILSDGGHDYSDATRFGTLTFINIPAGTKWDIASVYDELCEAMQGAQSQDYIVISHLTSICCVATALMVEWFGRVNFLIFRHDKYEEKVLILNDEVE